jgi:hypothetical protein
MRLRDVGLSLVGSAVVYVSMAACNAGSGAPTGTKSGGTGAHGTGGPVAAASGGGMGGAGSATDGTGTSGGSAGMDSGLYDALTDPVPTANADPADGTRLKATYRVGDDGSKEYVPGVWFDKTRDESCSFTTAGDGKTRCLPAGAAGGVYSDSACTQQMVAVPTGCTSPGYAITVDTTNVCGPNAGGTHVWTLGSATTPQALYVMSGTTCYAAGPAGSQYTYYNVGSEVPASSFVGATAGHD